jgi:biopolymer transport protein ExbD
VEGRLASWDVFHADRLELERGISTEAIRDGLARGVLQDDDLVRPAGTNVAWGRIGDFGEFIAPAQSASAGVAPPAATAAPAQRSAPLEPVLPATTPLPPPGPPAPVQSQQFGTETSDFEVVAEEQTPIPAPAPTLQSPDWFNLREESDDVAFPVLKSAPGQTSFEDELSSKPSEPTTPSEPGCSWREDEEQEEDGGEPDGEQVAEYTALIDDDDDDELEILDDDDVEESPAGPVLSRSDEDRPSSSRIALPVAASRDRDDMRPETDDDLEDADTFSLSRSGPTTVEELDLAPMVDVAFQLVLFFMVTATTVLYKTLEIPKPSTDAPPSGVTQGRSRSLDDFQKDYILVEIDASGAMKIDREPVAANMAVLVERLRTAREKTGRKSMLLSAEHATKHRSAVLAYDAANEINLGIVIARPQAPQGPAPALAPSGAQSLPAAKSVASPAPGSRPPPN